MRLTFTPQEDAKSTLTRWRAFLSNLGVSDNIAKKSAHAYLDKLKGGIMRSEFDLAPVTAKYAAYKARKKLDKRTLMATKRYVTGMRVVKVANNLYAVEANATMARMLEYGTKRMVARPHWRPALRKMRDGLARQVAEQELNRVLASR